jgi:eukaryotic-like serine/threonine-protein kinase
VREGIEVAVVDANLNTANCAIAGSEESADRLHAEIVDGILQRWREGESPCADEILARNSELLKSPDAALRLIYEEICLRRERGEVIDHAEVLARFPHWRAQLEVLFQCHSLLIPLAVAPLWPEVGETVGDYELLSELGRGGQGRVFLAAQRGLGDRAVVLKLTPSEGEEHLALARLQHTHIAPLYAVTEDAKRHLRALCMPYYGGAPLHEILDLLRTTPPSERTGQDLLEALARLEVPGAIPLPSRSPTRQVLARAGYVEAICWLGACLAEALQYAHERDLLHLDIKPSNVLLAADGQPMLLDFHLARPRLPAGGLAPAWFGGTPGYMSPEHEAAMAEASQGRPVPQTLDERSDVYALGLLLFEALGGVMPADRLTGVTALCRANPGVTPGLADLLRKCLAPAPGERYQQAAALAADLRRHLHHLPLKGARNRSLAERWRKWRHRSPHGLTMAIMGTTILTALVGWTTLGFGWVGQQRRTAEQALLEGEQLVKEGKIPQAVATLNRGVQVMANLPGGGALAQELARELRRAHRAEEGQQLHDLAERTRFLAGAAVPNEQVRQMEPLWRAAWGQRHSLLDRGAGELTNATEQQIQSDLLDLGLVWADLDAHQEGGPRQALEILAEIEALFGPSTVLCRQRQTYATALGQLDLAAQAGRRAAELVPRTAWEHYALGRSLLQAGDLKGASAALQRALDLRPQEFWSNFYYGVCAHRRERPGDAFAAFSVCLALAPESAECHYNRAVALADLGKIERALRGYDRALALDPTMGAAALNRGLLRLKQGHPQQAQADLKQALAHGSDPATVHYNLALVHLALRDRSAALASVQRALEMNPDHAGARQLGARLAGK